MSYPKEKEVVPRLKARIVPDQSCFSLLVFHSRVAQAVQALAAAHHLPIVARVDDTILPPGAPLRLGLLLDWALARAAALAAVPPEIRLATGVLDLRAGVFIPEKGGVPIRLTGREQDVLTALFQAPDRHMTRAQILEGVWNYVTGVETHTLETHMYRLRQKLEADPANPVILVTVPGGYALNVQT